MKLSALILVVAAATTTAFVPNKAAFTRTSVSVNGYLDDISKYTYDPDADVEEEDDSYEATKLEKDKVDRYSVGDWSGFVDFNEFDGGDGQMGVAGDGSKGLEKEWSGQAEMGKSKMRSAKNAWGTSTGYAEILKEQGVEATRAQQLENWRNQQEVQQERNQHKWMTENFDRVDTADDDWRKLSTFVGEQVSDTDLDKDLGPVQAGAITGTIDLSSRLNVNAVHEFSLKNPFMGFSDFRARFTDMTNPAEWTVEPTDGSLNGRGDPQQFSVKYRPQSPGASEGYLVVETEDDKWTYKLNGFGSM